MEWERQNAITVKNGNWKLERREENGSESRSRNRKVKGRK